MTQPAKPKPQEYTLTLRVLSSDRGDESGIRRLRAALKCLVRSYRLQPIRVVGSGAAAPELQEAKS
jgi:hypothetical protein